MDEAMLHLHARVAMLENAVSLILRAIPHADIVKAGLVDVAEALGKLQPSDGLNELLRHLESIKAPPA